MPESPNPEFSQSFYLLGIARAPAIPYSKRRGTLVRIRVLILSLIMAGVALAQAPSILDGGIVNGASFAAGQPVTGGALVSIFGNHLATQLAAADTVPLSTQLGGVTVQFVNGNNPPVNAPLLFVGPGNPDLINAQVPWNIVPPNSTQTVNVVVNVGGIASAPKAVTIGPFSPGIFAVNGRAVVVNNADQTLAWPAGSTPGLTTHPAKHHDVMIIYATGLGAVDNPPPDGANAGSQIRNTLTTPTVLVGGLAVTGPDFISSVLSPQFVGLYQVAFFVPNNAPLGDNISLQIQMGGITSPVNVTMAISQ